MGLNPKHAQFNWRPDIFRLIDEIFPQSLVSRLLVKGERRLWVPDWGRVELEQGDMKRLISGGILEQCYEFWSIV